MISKSLVGGQAAEAVIFWTGFRDRTEAVPCERLLGSAIGQSTAAIAAVVARAPGTKLVMGPTRGRSSAIDEIDEVATLEAWSPGQ